tara:strand:+ start:1615 stop:2325 length:711 start_codon:yes stop_codon:yes gene_type:complete
MTNNIYGYSDFIRLVQVDSSGVVDPESFGSGFEIRHDGVYLQAIPDGIILTPKEHSEWTQHPLGRPDLAVLAFPFSFQNLMNFIEWAVSENVSHDVPLDEGALYDLAAAEETEEATSVNGKNIGTLGEAASISNEATQTIEAANKETQHPSRKKKERNVDRRKQIIQDWFENQKHYDDASLKENDPGRPGARDACWRSIVEHGLTAGNEIFAGAKQEGSSKTKKFVTAWNLFIAWR